MPKFKVFAQWTMTAVVTVEADTIEEAVEIVQEGDDFPENEEYLSGSFIASKHEE
jgi:hypothetical protein